MLNAIEQVPATLGRIAAFLAGLEALWWFVFALGLVAIAFLILEFLRGVLTRRPGHMAPLVLAILIAAGLSYGFYAKYVQSGIAKATAQAPPVVPMASEAPVTKEGTITTQSVTRSASRNEQVLAIEDVLYGTNRKPGPKTANGKLTFGSDMGTLQYGMTQVTIPKDHKYGVIEKPIIIRIGPLTVFKEKENPAYHFTIMTNKALTEEGFKAALEKGQTKRALVYIHGYHTSFKNAAFTTAQIAYDIQFKGTPIFFSWPSADRLDAYFADNDKALASAPVLAKFLRDVRAGVGPKGEIFIIAHSLGNLTLLQALDRLAGSAVPSPPAKEVIFAAPDVDKNVFLSDIASLTREGEDMTLYASAGDKALLASAAFRKGAPRAGLVVDGVPVIVTPGVQTIDVSAVSTDFFDLNHGTYDENRLLLGDIGQLIATGTRPPNKRSNVMRTIKDGSLEYWQIPY